MSKSNNQLLHDAQWAIDQANAAPGHDNPEHELYVLERLLHAIACALVVRARQAAEEAKP